MSGPDKMISNHKSSIAVPSGKWQGEKKETPELRRWPEKGAKTGERQVCDKESFQSSDPDKDRLMEWKVMIWAWILDAEEMGNWCFKSSTFLWIKGFGVIGRIGTIKLNLRIWDVSHVLSPCDVSDTEFKGLHGRQELLMHTY